MSDQVRFQRERTSDEISISSTNIHSTGLRYKTDARDVNFQRHKKLTQIVYKDIFEHGDLLHITKV